MTSLPDGWIQRDLSSVCLKVQKVEPEALGRRSFRYVDIGSVDGDSHQLRNVAEVPADAAPSRARQLLAAGDTVFATVRPYLEKIAYIDETLQGEIASTGFCVLRPGEGVDPRWLFHFATSKQLLDQVLPLQRGASYPAVLDKDVKAAAIPLPPLEEQRRIVTMLEDHLSRLATGLADVGRSQRALGALRESMLNDIFLRSGSTASHMSSRWNSVRLGDVASVKGGKRLPRGTAWAAEATGHPYIRAKDIKQGQILQDELVQVPTAVWGSISRYVVEPGDVLITIAGTIGEVAEVPVALGGANLTENAARIRVDRRKVLPAYCALFLRSPLGQTQAQGFARATTQAKLALYRIEEITMPLPPIETQELIVEQAEAQLDYVASASLAMHNLAPRVVQLRRSLLQAAFTGRLQGDI